MYIRLACNGNRICIIKSVDGTSITCFCVHECEGSSRLGSRPRRFVLTGHSNGNIQIWDLTSALELAGKGELVQQNTGGPTKHELIRLLDQCDLSNSHSSTPCSTPCYTNITSATGNSSLRTKLKTANLVFLNNQLGNTNDETKWMRTTINNGQKFKYIENKHFNPLMRFGVLSRRMWKYWKYLAKNSRSILGNFHCKFKYIF